MLETSRNLLFILFVTFGTILLACANKQNGKAPGNGDAIGSDTVLQAGKSLYASYCLSCHQTDGSGVPGMVPPLTDTDWVIGDKKRLIESVLYGVKGEIEVNGVVYDQEMPPQDYLPDYEIAYILTYIRHEFGNGSSPVTEKEVAGLRKNEPNTE